MRLRIRLFPLLLILAGWLFIGGLVGATTALIKLATHAGQTCVSAGDQKHCGTNFEVSFDQNGKMIVLHPGDPGFERCDDQGVCTIDQAQPVPPHGDGR